MEKAEKKLVYLGGCMRDKNGDDKYYCKVCEKKFRWFKSNFFNYNSIKNLSLPKFILFLTCWLIIFNFKLSKLLINKVMGMNLKTEISFIMNAFQYRFVS